MLLQRAGLGVVLIGGAILLPAAASLGAVSLAFSDKDATPTSRGAAANTQFTVDVLLNESAAADRVSGLDYKLSASSSSRFQIVSRTSTSVLSPYATDASLAGITLSPTSGAPDLGGSTPSGSADLAGSATGTSYDLAAYVIKVLAGTPNGTYTLSFVSTNFAAASTAPPADNAFATLGTFAITVPEPTTAVVAAASVIGLGLSRRRAGC